MAPHPLLGGGESIFPPPSSILDQIQDVDPPQPDMLRVVNDNVNPFLPPSASPDPNSLSWLTPHRFARLVKRAVEEKVSSTVEPTATAESPPAEPTGN